LGDIAAAYEKNSKLESLLFDDFFNKGEILSILPSRHNLPNHNSCSQGTAWLEACHRSGCPLGHPYPRLQHSVSFLRWVQERDRACEPHSSAGMSTIFDFDYMSKSNILSATTSVPTHSVFFPARKIQNSRREKIFVSA